MTLRQPLTAATPPPSGFVIADALHRGNGGRAVALCATRITLPIGPRVRPLYEAMRGAWSAR